jgi:hypothetical protein
MNRQELRAKLKDSLTSQLAGYDLRNAESVERIDLEVVHDYESFNTVVAHCLVSSEVEDLLYENPDLWLVPCLIKTDIQTVSEGKALIKVRITKESFEC